MLCSHDNVEAEKVEVCAAVHGALNQLQSMNVSFDWNVASGLLKCGKNRCSVAPKEPSEVH